MRLGSFGLVPAPIVLLILTLSSALPSSPTVADDRGGMVVIPEGPFQRGAPEGQGDADEHPQRTIHLNAFSIDRYEVTNRDYRAFVVATRHRIPEHCCDPDYNLWTGPEIAETLLDHPVINVDWSDAVAYCVWAGKRLPSEAEWERAAKGVEGRLFPWGNQQDRMRVNGAAYWAQKDFGSQEDTKAWWAETGAVVAAHLGVKGILTVPVTTLEEGATPDGLMHMAGNVWEWVADWYDPQYYETSPERNPKGPEGGDFKTLRGGSWLNHQHMLRTTARDGARPTMRNHGTGFRCAAGS